MKISSHGLMMLKAEYLKLLHRNFKLEAAALRRAGFLLLPAACLLGAGPSAAVYSVSINGTGSYNLTLPVLSSIPDVQIVAGENFNESGVPTGASKSYVYDVDYDVHGQDTSVDGAIFGGRSLSSGTNKDISGYSLSITGDTTVGKTAANYSDVAGGAIGGYSLNGNVTGNSLSIANGTIYNLAAGGMAPRGSARGNVVEISDGQIGDADETNHVPMFGSVSTYCLVAGGFSLAKGTAAAIAVDNNVASISGGDQYLRIYGGLLHAMSNYSGSVSVSGNQVYISGGSFKDGVSITGGAVDLETGMALSGTVSIKDNAVYLNYAYDGSSATALNSVLDLANVSVYGYTDATESVTVSGNTIYASGLVNVHAIDQFNTLSLNVGSVNSLGNGAEPSGDDGAGVAVLNVTDAVNLDQGSLELTSEQKLSEGNYALVYSTNGVTASSISSTSITRNGTFTKTVYSNITPKLSSDGQLLYVALPEYADDDSGDDDDNGDDDDDVKVVTTVTAESETLAAAGLASVALVAAGNAFSSAEGIQAAVNAAQENDNPNAEVTLFAVAGGGSQTFKIGSHFDVDSFNATVGGTKLFKFGDDRLTLAAFLDYGFGHARIHAANAAASTDNYYYGLGIGGHYRFSNGLFVDSSLRIGRAKAEFDGAYARTGAQAKYDSKTTYFGASLGAGWSFELTENLSLTPYARYFFTYTGSDNADVKVSGTTERLHLDAVKAHTLRGGADLTCRLSESWLVRGGAAVEHTFNGKARSQLDGIDLAAPSLKGTSGIISAGVRFTPQPSFSVELGAAGRVGDVHGVSGRIKAVYRF